MEHAGQPFFSGEVEPCINGRTITLGIYFGQDMDDLVTRLLGEQLEDGGWNCEVENGSVRSSFATTINVLEGLLAHERATAGSPESIAHRGNREVREFFQMASVIVEELCTGCGLCVAACGPACLETQNQVVVVERPNDCGSEEHCISACPEDAIHMVWLPAEGDLSIGLWRSPSNMKSKSRTRKASSLLAHKRK